MTSHTEHAVALRRYRAQLTECSRSFTVGRSNGIDRFLTGADPRRLLEMFTDGNRYKRFLKLKDQFEELDAAFDNLDDLIDRYIRRVPLAAYETGSSDGEKFLQWITVTTRPTAEQQDVIACQQCRYSVETTAERHRLDHLRFQEIWASVRRFSAELETNPALWIHLNPIHSWTRFHTRALLDDEADLPACVVFFPVASDIRTAVLEASAEALARDLELFGPCRLDDLLAGDNPTVRREVIDICLDMADIGLVAFG